MKWARLRSALLCLVAACIASAVSRASEGYLRVEGIPGEVDAPDHKQWIRVTSVGTVLTNSNRAIGAGGSTGRAFSELSLLKSVDKASPRLVLACASGTTLPEVELELVTVITTSRRLYRIELKDAVVRSVRASGAAAGSEAKPMEEVVLAFAWIRWTYANVSLSTQRTVTSEWDFVRSSGSGTESGGSAVFKVTGIWKGESQVTLYWQGRADRTYVVHSSPQIDGPFGIHARVSPGAEGLMTYKVPALEPALFFLVEETP